MARHWRGVAFPNGETDLVKSTKLALSDDLRSLKLGKRSRVWRGFHSGSAHFAHSYRERSPFTIFHWSVEVSNFRTLYRFYCIHARLRPCPVARCNSGRPGHRVGAGLDVQINSLRPISHGSSRCPLLRRPFCHQLRPYACGQIPQWLIGWVNVGHVRKHMSPSPQWGFASIGGGDDISYSLDVAPPPSPRVLE